MKYGQFLKNVDERAPPQLRGKFFSYKALKKVLKHVATEHTADPASAAAARAEFEAALDAAVSAADATFHAEALAILDAYDAVWGDGASRLLARLRRWRDRKGAGDAAARSALALRAAWCRRYARINTVGLRKIVKKYGKATGDPASGDILQSFWSGARGGALFLSSPLLTELRAVEALLVPPEEWADAMAAAAAARADRRGSAKGSGSLSRGASLPGRRSGAASPLPPPAPPPPPPRPRRPGKEPAPPPPPSDDDDDDDEDDAVGELNRDSFDSGVRGLSPAPHVARAALSDDDALFTEDDDDDDDDDVAAGGDTTSGPSSSSPRLWPRRPRRSLGPRALSLVPPFPSPFGRVLSLGAGPSTASSGGGTTTALSSASTFGTGAPAARARPPAALAAASALDAARSDGGMFGGGSPPASPSGGSGDGRGRGRGGGSTESPRGSGGGSRGGSHATGSRAGGSHATGSRQLLRPPSTRAASTGLTRVSLTSVAPGTALGAPRASLLFAQPTVGAPGSRSSSVADAALLDAALKCPICLDYMYRPLGLACGHAFCTECALTAAGHGGDVGSLRAVLGALDPDEPCPECRRPAAFAAAHAMRETGALVRARHFAAWIARRDEARIRDAARRAVLEERRLRGRAATPLDVLRPGRMDEY